MPASQDFDKMFFRSAIFCLGIHHFVTIRTGLVYHFSIKNAYRSFVWSLIAPKKASVEPVPILMTDLFGINAGCCISFSRISFVSNRMLIFLGNSALYDIVSLSRASILMSLVLLHTTQ